MKNYNEITNDLIERRDRYIAEKNIKRKRVMSVATSLCCVCLVALLGFGMWQGGMYKTTSTDLTKDGSIYTEENKNNTNDTFVDSNLVDDKNNNDTPSNNEENSVDKNNIPFNNSDDICDILGMVVIDGITYIQVNTDIKTAEAYTLDNYLGIASDFEGTYKTHLDDIIGKLYTTKEDQNVLVVKLDNGGTVVLKKTKQ